MATQPDASQSKIRLEIVPKGNFFEDIALAHEIGSEIPALLEETQEFVVQPVYDGKLGGAEAIVLDIVALGTIAGPVILASAENKVTEIVVEKIAEKIKQLFRKKKVSGDKEPLVSPIIKSPESYKIEIQGSPHSEVTISWRNDQEQATITIKVSA